MVAERDRLPVLIGTRRFQIDWRNFTWSPMASIRQAQDSGAEPGEQSFDNQGIWKRTQSDFVLGAGQDFFDQEDESNRRQFRSSKGIDPWDRRSITLLKDTTSVDAAIGDGDSGILLSTASYLYAAGNQSVSKFDTSDTETAITGLAAARVTDLTVWGDYVYIAQAGQRLKRVAISGSAASDWSIAGITPTKAKVVSGRLVCTDDNVIYELSESAGTGVKLGSVDIFEHPQTSFEFHTIVGAPNGIYVAGDDNNNSVVYLLTVVDATGELAAPYPVGETLDGEFIRDMIFYGGVMFVATSKGVRLANISGSGFLSFGPLLDEPGDVKCITAWEQFVWFGWTNFDASSTGLGRMAPEYFTKPFIPAYASDVMYSDQGIVWDCAVFNDRVYYIFDRGTSCRVVREHATDYVSEGVLYSGGITYGTPEKKSVFSADAQWDTLPSGASVSLAVLDGVGGSSTAVFTNSTAATGASGDLASTFEKEIAEVKLTITRGATATARPRVRRWTIRSQPLPYRAEEIIVPVILADAVKDGSVDVGGDAYDDFIYLRGLYQGRTRVPFEFGFSGITDTVIVDSVQPIPETITGWDGMRKFLQGTYAVRLVTAP